MKKLISALFAAVLMAAGLVVASAGTASADCTPSQYSGCVTTKTKAIAPSFVKQRAKATVCAKVKAPGSNATPTGRIKFTVTRNKGDYVFKDSVSYSGSKVCVTTGKLKKKGGYTLTAKFKSPSGSVFTDSSDSAGFDVG